MKVLTIKIALSYLIATGISLLVGCQPSGSSTKGQSIDSAITLRADAGTIRRDTVTLVQDDCIFDNDMERLSRDALSAYDATIQGVWDTTSRQLYVQLEGGDRLELRIGGCNHFIYEAYLETAIPFGHTSELLQKMVWITSSFFGKSYGTDYERIIASKAYKLQRTEQDEQHLTGHYYEITEPVAEIDNVIREGFFLYDRGAKGAAIRVSFYIN